MKRLAITVAALLIFASLARAADEVVYLETLLKEWQAGTAPKDFKGPFDAKQLTSYDIISVVFARLNGVDTALFNVLCVLPPQRLGENESTWRAVFRVSREVKPAEAWKASVAWRRFDDSAPAPRPATPPVPSRPLTSDEKSAAAKLLPQLRSEKLDPGAKDDRRRQLVAMGPAVLPLAERELRTGDMHHRQEFCRLVDALGPTDQRRYFGEELSNAATVCTRIVSRIQDDAQQAAEYRDRAARCRQTTGGNIGGLKFKPEPTERDSFLRLAARFDEKVADSRRELDACAEVLESLCGWFAANGADADLPVLLGIVSDKSAATRVPGWSSNVVRDDEHSQMPPVGFSTHRDMNVPNQEQDWLPWGPVWGTLRTLIAKRAGRDALIDLRDALEKSFVPLEKARTGSWQQASLVAEFQRTEGRLIARLASAQGATPGAAPADYAADAREKLLAVIYGTPDKPGEDEWDKRRRLGHQAEERLSEELVTWHVVMKFEPGAAAAPMDVAKEPPKVVADPCFMTGAFEAFKEVLPVTAFLEMRARPDGSVSRILLGTFDVPLKAPVAADIEKGKRRVALELWCRLKIAEQTPRTLGAVTDICIPVDVKRLLLRDLASGAALYDSEKARPKVPDKPKTDPKPKPPADDDRDVIMQR